MIILQRHTGAPNICIVACQAGPGSVLFYTLRSVAMSGQYKYRRNPSACKIAEESACMRTHPLKSMASGPLKIEKGTRPVLILATHHHTTESVWQVGQLIWELHFLKVVGQRLQKPVIVTIVNCECACRSGRFFVETPPPWQVIIYNSGRSWTASG